MSTGASDPRIGDTRFLGDFFGDLALPLAERIGERFEMRLGDLLLPPPADLRLGDLERALSLVPMSA
jgi:hypothetical protein